MRKRFHLTKQEVSEFDALRPEPARIWAFWQAACVDRNLDMKTILCDERFPHSFTALPPNHGKHWCWPSALRLEKQPPRFGDQPGENSHG